jgi:hypothetical protein
VPPTVTEIESSVVLVPDWPLSTSVGNSVEVGGTPGAEVEPAALTTQYTLPVGVNWNGHHPSVEEEPATQLAPLGVGHCVPAGP